MAAASAGHGWERLVHRDLARGHPGPFVEVLGAPVTRQGDGLDAGEAGSTHGRHRVLHHGVAEAQFPCALLDEGVRDDASIDVGTEHQDHEAQHDVGLR